MDKSPILVTGCSGFIGFWVSERLLKNGYQVIGIDNLNDYYDVSLKSKRQKILEKYEKFHVYKICLTDFSSLHNIFTVHKPRKVFHFAAQAGVRDSWSKSQAYIDNNILASFNLFKLLAEFKPDHSIVASTSSVYGGNEKIPFCELDPTDKPLSIYAATKKSMENLAYTFSNAFEIDTTILRFFTVYGPWGRPDMALFKFTKNILNDRPIEIYNYGEMTRDFTYVSDLTDSIIKLSEIPPSQSNAITNHYRVINIGNADPVDLNHFIECLETVIGKKAQKKYIPLQMGDMKNTFADTSQINSLIGSLPKTSLENGITNFVEWYMKYYDK